MADFIKAEHFGAVSDQVAENAYINRDQVATVCQKGPVVRFGFPGEGLVVDWTFPSTEDALKFLGE